MALAPSPLFDTTKFSRRNLAKIPKDQQDLLEATDSWAVELRDQPHGLVQVPGHVVKTATEAYLANTGVKDAGSLSDSGSSHRSANSSHKHPGAAEQSPPPESSPVRPEVSTPKRTTRAGDERSTPARREVSSPAPSWSPSPVREYPTRQLIAGSPMVCETPAAPPMAPPPRPSPLPQPAPNFTFPSTDNEDDLETELPQALSLPDAPVNREAVRLPIQSSLPMPSSLSENTPPCAQPEPQVIHSSLLPEAVLRNSRSPERVIPMTEQRDRSRLEVTVPQEQRSRRMKPIQFSRAKPTRTTKELTSLTRQKPLANTSAVIDDSSSTPLSSVIPESQPQHTWHFAENYTMTQERAHTHMDEGSHNRDGHPAEYVSQAAITAERPSRKPSTASVAISEDGDQDPYTAYTTAYPEYTNEYGGNLSNFVMACVSLGFLQKEGMLMEFLYDDFVRAYSSGYLPYSRNAGAGQEALPSLEWFNTFISEPVFRNKVITKANLNLFLEWYPIQVSKARKTVKGDMEGNTSKQHTPASNDSTSVDHRDATPSGDPKQSPLTMDGPMDFGQREPTPTLHRSTPARSNLPPSQHLFTQPPAPPSPELGRHSPLVASTARSTPAKIQRVPASSRYFDQPPSSRRSSSLSTPADKDKRSAQLERFLMKRKRKSAGDGSVTSSKRGPGSRAQG